MIHAILQFSTIIILIVLHSQGGVSDDNKAYSGRPGAIFRPVDTSATKGSLSEQYGVTFKTNKEGSCQPWWPKLSKSFDEARDAVLSALQALDHLGVPRPPRENRQGRGIWDRSARSVAALWDIHVSDGGWKKDGRRSVAVFEQIQAVYNSYLDETKYHGRLPKYELYCGTDWLEWDTVNGEPGWWSIYKTSSNGPFLSPPRFRPPIKSGPLSSQPFDLCNGGEAATLKRQNAVIMCPNFLRQATDLDTVQRRTSPQSSAGRSDPLRERMIEDLENTLAREWIFQWGHLIQRWTTPPHIDSRGDNRGGSTMGYSSCVNLARYAPQLALDSSPETYALFAVMVHASYADWTKGYASDPQTFTVSSQDISSGTGRRPIGPPRRDTFSGPNPNSRPRPPSRTDSSSGRDRNHRGPPPGLIEKGIESLAREAIKYCKKL
ncbi:hypothetical protein EV356DRAFT_89616 [Viridothelium virens]|uniref:Uncharacterized protein n=1 Tax=Viridothelium virens TaxID=1048519 RepID=A0A6A6HEJ6_VIRVR|nr:hypothetical protein EV356DRAFT_89616 [Viridothelium virens]